MLESKASPLLDPTPPFILVQ